MATKLSELLHPEYKKYLPDWKKFRIIAEGGSEFINTYLQKFSTFESSPDFNDRKSFTYNPCHAAAAVRQVKNAIFQRLVDVRREGGSASYQTAMEKDVDKKNRGMNAFLGECVLPDLLNISKVGVFVDMPVIENGASLADTVIKRPYLYTFTAEDILNWVDDDSEETGRYKTVLLRVHKEKLDEIYALPEEYVCEYLLIKKNITTSTISITKFDKDCQPIASPPDLTIKEIPLVIFDLEESLLQDIADYQIASLQLASSDINFLFKANFPVYVEMIDSRFNNQIRGTPLSGTGTAEQARSGAPVPTTLEERVTRTISTQPEANQEGSIPLGSSGRGYGKGLDQPAFINPSSEPVIASMKKEKEMAEEIRVLLDLALTSLGARYASAESKAKDSAGLEAGLSYIGLILQRGEQEIARLWSMYDKGPVAKVTYPTNYSLRTDEDRKNEAKTIEELSSSIPSKTFTKVMQKRIASTLMIPRSTPEELNVIFKEIDDAQGLTSDSEILRTDSEAGFVSQKTASKLRGYADGESELAAKDHEARLQRITQNSPDKKMPGQTMMESEKGKDTTNSDSTKSTDRGPGSN